MLSGVEPADLLTTFRSEGERIAWTAAGRDLDVPVPYCDGLDTGAVIRHLGSVYQRTSSWLALQQPPGEWQRTPPHDTDVRSWYAGGMRTLYERLAGHRPDEPCDTWFTGDRSYLFWWRRMAHETTIHRMDVTEAYGLHYPVADGLAVDGIDEALTLWLGTRLGTDVRGTNQVVAIEAGTHVWRVTLQQSAIDVAAEIPWECDAAMSGPPEDVYRWLWGRGPLEALRVSGDMAAVAALRETMARATQ
ncbi:MAG TPA: maleylpyruvate isomerase family mycothiol-dependent enzyme [Streptosporangiaceae bacterium]|nr:maleylpyruvate isomerase family mycothiol-dependent enzyme [Streptosporangiaceae bacterium]